MDENEGDSERGEKDRNWNKVQFKTFLTNLKGPWNLFVVGEFLYSQYKKKRVKGQSIYFLTDEFSLEACSLEWYLTVSVVSEEERTTLTVAEGLEACHKASRKVCHKAFLFGHVPLLTPSNLLPLYLLLEKKERKPLRFYLAFSTSFFNRFLRKYPKIAPRQLVSSRFHTFFVSPFSLFLTLFPSSSL